MITLDDNKIEVRKFIVVLEDFKENISKRSGENPERWHLTNSAGI